MKTTLQLFILATSLACCLSSYAQDTTAKAVADSAKFKTVQIQASFPGGDQAWIEFLQNNLRPDVPVKKKAPAGRYDVILVFLVDKTGQASDFKVEKDPGFGTAQEALRVMKKAPRWNPAKVNGVPVIYRQKQMISFEVVEEEDTKKKKRA